MSLKGKVAWITGGGSGIGLAGAMELAKAGAQVVISGRTAATNASALKQLQAVGSAEVLQLEVSDRKAVAKAAKDILGRHQHIDILINSASLVAALRYCADEKPSARIVDCERIKRHPFTIDDLV